jgi:Flp pilus assembly protein TadD
MSLLMKALEKAAKDRGEAQSPSTTPAVAETKPELSLALELLAADTPSPRVKEETRPAGERARAGARVSSEQAQAAILMEAASGSSSGVVAFARARPLVVFSVLAALFAAGYGVYLYLQIFHPALFVPAAPSPVPPLATPSTPPAEPSAPPSEPAPVVAPPLAAAPILQPTAPEPGTETPSAPSAPSARPEPLPNREKPQPRALRDTIVVNHGNPEPRINPLLSEAYAALQAGRLDVARQLYESVARADPGSIDAQLGLAAIAMQQGKTEEATRHYMAILRLDPRHALAQSGLIALAGRADPLASETRLKQLIARDPSPFLYFTLGNLYADQGLWAQAQQAYFQAHHLEPGNPDYAFNLAVGLEHLSQPRLALDFYRRAVELARARGHANFDVEQAQARADKLAAQAE